MSILSILLSTDFLFTAIRVMTPILFAALSCMSFSKGGIDPIGTEGIMLGCALAGPVGGYYLDSAIAGVILAMLIGVILACVFGYFTLVLDTNPVLCGIALNTLSGGLTIFITYYLTGNKGSTQSLNSPAVSNIELPIIKNIPVVRDIVSGHSALTYTALLLTVLLAVFYWRTATGLRIRAVGENSVAASSVGINIMKYKIISLIIAGSLAGMGGAFMSMSYVEFFSRNMIAGRGWIGMAAESMGHGNPFGILASVFIFGLADSMSIRFQLLNLPARLIQTIPYTITIIAIAVYSRYNINKKNKKSKKILKEIGGEKVA